LPARGRRRPRLSLSEPEEIMIGCAQRRVDSRLRVGRGEHRRRACVKSIAMAGAVRRRPRYRALYRFGANRGGWDAKSRYRASLAQARCEAAPAGQRLASWAAVSSDGRSSLLISVDLAVVTDRHALGVAFTADAVAVNPAIPRVSYPRRAKIRSSHPSFNRQRCRGRSAVLIVWW
jgi:hypothetical protein